MEKTTTTKELFQFKQFQIDQQDCTMKIGTDGVLLGAWADVSGANKILDIGTGTGVIAIMLAQRAVEAQVDAVEIDEPACKTAIQNMAASPFAARLTAHQASIQNFAKISKTEYDLVVCNPPFFTGGTLSSSNDRNNVRHTVKLPNGELLSSVRRVMAKGGKFCVILPYLEGLRFKELAANYNLYCTRMVEVKPKKDKSVERLLLQFEKEAKEIQMEGLVIQREKRNDYTKAYVDLTKAFYLKM